MSQDTSDSDGDDYREQLERNRVEVVQSLDLDRQFMLSYLRSNSILDDEDCQLILNSGASRQQKNSKFLDVISSRGKKAYSSFVSALEFEHCCLYELFTGKKASKTKCKFIFFSLGETGYYCMGLITNCGKVFPKCLI